MSFDSIVDNIRNTIDAKAAAREARRQMARDYLADIRRQADAHADRVSDCDEQARAFAEWASYLSREEARMLDHLAKMGEYDRLCREAEAREMEIPRPEDIQDF